MKCVILAGGGGLRLWPLSRGLYPKQFLSLTNNNTMFIETILRNKALSSSYMVLTNFEYRFIVEHQMNMLNITNYELLLETVGRNTAPAIALACMYNDPDELLLVVPADAYISNIELYKKAVRKAQTLAEQGYIVAFGVTPTIPHTGYGYIKHKDNDVLAFKEKPDYELAKQYLSEGDYLWNSGMYLFRTDVLLSELSKYRNDIYTSCKRVTDRLPRQKAVILEKQYMLEIPSESIDYAVMEHTEKIKVVPTSFEWSDVGSLEAVADTLKADKYGNRCTDKNIILNDSANVSVINSADNQLVVVNGIKDIVVVNTIDALYISAKGRSSDIKKIIESSKDLYNTYFSDNHIVYRSWGSYVVLNDDSCYRVRRITIYPGKYLSLHKHENWAEHWTVVVGTATVTVGDEVYKLKANNSIDIPACTLHRLSNDTDENVEVVEISMGDSISDDDIFTTEKDFDGRK